MFALGSALTPGTTYYWRVDTLTAHEIVPSDVYHFTVSEISASLSEIVTATVRGHSNLQVPVDLASAEPGKAWTATSETPWISFQQTSGVTPATLNVVIDASNLAAGVHLGLVSVGGSSGGPFTIPVKLRVDALKLTILKSSRSSSIVYGISENPASVPGTAYLLELDAATESILRVVPVGASVTDLAVHDGDQRIYVPNWQAGILRAIDRNSFLQVRSYSFNPAGSAGSYDRDVFRVTAGTAGRLIIEENDQWINVSIFDTGSGGVLANSFQREGGGAADPTGRYYYHGDNNSSGAQLHKLDLLGDRFTSLGSVRLNPLSYYGSRVVVASDDGTRIFWNGMVHDQNLGPVVNLADYIYASTENGRYAFGEQRIYDTQTGQPAFGMPADTKVSAFNSTTRKLVVQVGDSMRYFSFVAPFTMPAPLLSAVLNTNGTVTLSWTDNSLETGFTLQLRLGMTSLAPSAGTPPR